MKLPRPQLHLSTCIVLMFVAGGLLWPNLVFRHCVENANSFRARDLRVQGWPFPIIEDDQLLYERTDDGRTLQILNEDKDFGFSKVQSSDGRILFRNSAGEFEFIPVANGEAPYRMKHRKGSIQTFNLNIVANFYVAALILAATAFLCEWAIRRRTKVTSDV